ncbi:MAG: hypothetical protein DRI88_04970 [Bacteroidetes bacterium]|nr:MAG: hypothetical protein DRI88_04970 [Bacteroidota bacterium]RLD74110.1 MAG: hypothetical protein DRI87_02050 [Bacteroidota bacterium]RLD85397.1 MAG: hypothetical protein DRJ02_10480 [Bacteroidota bacterium]HHJ10362.1 two pore domain potassium channel family protein [Bacteroidota bacterium]
MLKRMQPKARHNIILLVLNFIYIFVLGLFADTNNINFVYYTCISLIYFASVLVIKDESRYYFYFPAVMIILTWITEFLNFPLLSDITGIISTIFFFGIIVLLIIRVAKSKRVTIVEFLESINIYMLLGIAASILFGFLYRIKPEAFSASTGNFSSQADFIYFSFVTITTLGYGDILPVSHLARSLAIMFSVTGQLYLTMIIAMLVGKYLSVNQVNTNPKD